MLANNSASPVLEYSRLWHKGNGRRCQWAKTYRILPMEVEGDGRVVYNTYLFDIPTKNVEVFDIVTF